MHPAIGIARGVSEREARRCAVLLERLAQFEKSIGVLWKRLEAGGARVADAVVHGSTGGTLGQRDPAFAAYAVALGDIVPSAILASEIVGEICEIDQLIGELVWIVQGPDDQIGASADVGGDGRFGPDVLPAFAVE